jgi:predicted ATP-dependent endonuclease of OLD family
VNHSFNRHFRKRLKVLNNMRKIKKVVIEGFWGDKTVILNFDEDINFLIGVNGSGKTTIINLIAASLNADFTTLDKALFAKIRVDFFPEKKKANDEVFIEIEKKDKQDSPYPNINFKIKLPNETKPKTFKLNELEEEVLFRYPNEYLRRRIRLNTGDLGRDINLALHNIVSLTWLSIHRSNRLHKNQDEKSFESTIDQKINELSTDLIKYFGILDKRYSLETEKFQKNIFLSLLEDAKEDNLVRTDDLDSEKEKESLKQIFFIVQAKGK